MKKIAALLTTSAFLTLYSNVFAAVSDGFLQEGEVKQPKDLGIPTGTTLGTIIGNLIGIVMVLAALLVFVFLIIGAFSWITSGGDKEKVASARETILHALIGLVILAVAFVIARVAGQVVGIDILNIKIPQLTNPNFNP